MNRAYRFGAVALAVVAAGLVFASFVPPVQLTEYEATDERFRKTAIFLRDDREVFPVSGLNEPLPASGRARLVVELGDRAGIRIESVKIGIRAPRRHTWRLSAAIRQSSVFSTQPTADTGAFLRSRIRGCRATGR